MRTVLVIAAALLISQYGRAQGGGRGRGGAAQLAAPANPGFECFSRVETPEFPQAALRAHIDGTVYVWIQLTAQAAVDKIDNQVASSWGDGPKLLVPAVEKAIRASAFKPECAGKTVAVVYRYDLHGEAIASPKPVEKTEGDVMYIDSQPGMAVAAKGR